MLVVTRKVGQRLVVTESVAAPGSAERHFVGKPMYVEILGTNGEGRRASVRLCIRAAAGVSVRPARS
jgi:sRNA-binding carbon storage regulator CsrA